MNETQAISLGMWLHEDTAKRYAENTFYKDVIQYIDPTDSQDQAKEDKEDKYYLIEYRPSYLLKQDQQEPRYVACGRHSLNYVNNQYVWTRTNIGS
jgi:wobble nucleotide-excising tRNase